MVAVEFQYVDVNFLCVKKYLLHISVLIEALCESSQRVMLIMDVVYSGAARGPDAAEGEIFVLGPCGWAIQKRESRDTQEMS